MPRPRRRLSVSGDQPGAWFFKRVATTERGGLASAACGGDAGQRAPGTRRSESAWSDGSREANRSTVATTGVAAAVADPEGFVWNHADGGVSQPSAELERPRTTWSHGAAMGNGPLLPSQPRSPRRSRCLPPRLVRHRIIVAEQPSEVIRLPRSVRRPVHQASRQFVVDGSNALRSPSSAGHA